MRHRKSGVDVGGVLEGVPEMIAVDFVSGANLYVVRRVVRIDGRRLRVEDAPEAGVHDQGEDDEFDGAHV
jgi:hypothetical protein